jgi:hypothetical protein
MQVLESKLVVDRPKGNKAEGLKVAECIVGDQSGCIVFSARNEQGGISNKLHAGFSLAGTHCYCSLTST